MSGTKRWAAGLFIALIFMYNHIGALAQGETSAKAACVMELETGRVLFEYHARARLPLAYLASALDKASLTPMGFAAPVGSLLSVVICLLAYRWMGKHPEKWKEGKTE